MKNIFILIVSLCCSAQPLYAQDLLYYYDLARQNDADFKAAEFAYEAALQIKKQAWSALLPQLTGSIEYGNINQDVTKSKNLAYQEGKKEYDNRDYSLTLTQPVINVSSLVRLNQAETEILSAGIELETSRQDLILRVAEAYLNALAGVTFTETVEAEKKAVERLYNVTNKKFTYGLARKTDLYDAKARLALVESDYIEALNFKEDAFEALKTICNEDVFAVAPLSRNIIMKEPEPDDVNIWLDNALKNNLELIFFNYKVKIARQEKNKQIAGHLPTVDVVGQYKVESSSGDVLASGGGNEIESKDIYVRLNVPLFEGGYTQSKVTEAIAVLNQVIKTRESKRRNAKRETRSAFLKVKSSIIKSKALLSSLESQKLAVKARRKGFEAGLYNLLDVLDAERIRYIAERDYETARFDYIFNSLKLKQAVGSLSAEDIRRINNFFQ